MCSAHETRIIIFKNGKQHFCVSNVFSIRSLEFFLIKLHIKNEINV
jgi:hypothetical protein